MAKIGVTEHHEQKKLFSWAAIMANQYPDLKWLYAVPNAAARSFALAAYMKAEGVKAGVPDLCLPVARGGFHGLYMELKVKLNKPTEAQEAWLEALWMRGYFTRLCWSFEEARDIILEYLKKPVTQ